MKYTLLTITTILLCTSCSSAPSKHCQEPDWYEIGRQAGAQGQRAVASGQTEPTCPETNPKQLKRLYTNGYNAGIAEFCSTDNGFLLGRNGARLVDLCPGTLAQPFQRAFERGQNVLKLEQTQRQLAKKVSSLKARLNRGGLNEQEKEKLSQEKSSLEKALAGNEKKLSRLRSFN